MKQIIKLTESDLHRIVEGVVRKMLTEYGDEVEGSGQEYFGQIAGQAIIDGNREKLSRINKIATEKGGGAGKSGAFRRGMLIVMDDPDNSNKMSSREHNKRKKGA